MNVLEKDFAPYVPLSSYKEPRDPSLPEISASSFAGKVVPERRFHDNGGNIPHTGVTLLYGDGGTGKSLTALQLAAATVTGRQWLGLDVQQGPVVYFSAEDDLDESHIRLNAIAENSGVELSEMGDLKIMPMVGQECIMAMDTGKGIVKPTPLFTAFSERVTAIQPALVIIDNAIDILAIDQNNASQVKQAMHVLSSLSVNADCPVLLLAHPSKAGMANGTGDGGSVHWSNSARSRLYLSRIYCEDGNGIKHEDDANARQLTRMKANYTATGDGIKLHWKDGVFVHEAGNTEPTGNGHNPEQYAENTFIDLLNYHNEKGLSVSPERSSAYAPTLFANHINSNGVSKNRFEKAMQTLLKQGKIEQGKSGPASRQRWFMRVVPQIEEPNQ